MRKNIQIIFCCLSLSFSSCSNVETNSANFDSVDSIIDNTSESFNQTIIGTQIWMTENLSVRTFRNGDSIKMVSTLDEWKKAYLEKCPALYMVNMSEDSVFIETQCAKGQTFVIYNWYAVCDKRNLAPLGWRIPQTQDWSALLKYVGSEEFLLAEECVNSSPKDTYGFALSITPYYFYSRGVYWSKFYSCFWTLDSSQICLSTFFPKNLNDNDFSIPEQLRWSSKFLNDGCCVRCIKE